MSRYYRVYDGDELIEEGFNEISWEHFRSVRDSILKHTDVFVLGDRVISEEMVEYRQFLRDLPENYEGDNANAAVDAWSVYTVPSEVE